jgi:hypothetical protein
MAIAELATPLWLVVYARAEKLPVEWDRQTWSWGLMGEISCHRLFTAGTRGRRCLTFEAVRCVALADEKNEKPPPAPSGETLPTFHIGKVCKAEARLISRAAVDDEAPVPISNHRSFAVNDYEIRIVSNGQPATVLQGYQISDFAAIRRGHAIAKVDDVVEVWRGINCVYAGRHRPAPSH